jgi:hypothetical protein
MEKKLDNSPYQIVLSILHKIFFEISNRCQVFDFFINNARNQTGDGSLLKNVFSQFWE